MYDMSALYQAESVQDAIRLRLEHPEAQIIAGGTDVLVQMREGKRAGKAIISIQGCREMRGVSLDDQENLRIGSLTTFSHITADPLIQRYINVLGEAVDMVGGPRSATPAPSAATPATASPPPTPPPPSTPGRPSSRSPAKTAFAGCPSRISTSRPAP